MNVRSLGYRTDLIFPRFADGEIRDRGDYLVIRTPSNPGFHWGNFLLFAHPPQTGDLARWKRIFEDEIASRQPAHHWTFGWDAPDGDAGEIAPFEDAGFQVDRTVILTTNAVRRPPRYNDEATVRPLQTDDDWRQATDNQVICRDAIYGEAVYRTYKERQMARYRQMSEAGRGAWLGAFLGKRLVADLGVFADETGTLARFQSVGTHPDFRRRGICGALVHQASEWALNTLRVGTLVMAADEEYHAAKIYESVGFQPTERQIGASWWDRTAG